MAASEKTLRKVLQILGDSVTAQEDVIEIVNRLYTETVPSGNKSYDETITRLRRMVHA